jgi:aminopeptidase N
MKTVSRLIDQFIPTHYDLSLNLEREERKFSGTVSIHGTSTPDSTAITVHAKNLVIESATIDGHEAEFTAGKNDEVSITMPKFIPGKHIVVIGFHGTITDTMHGLYPCYFEVDGVKQELLATQFESHHAREVFPCLDEPAAKATFDVSLLTEPGITALSNMPVKTKRVENGKQLTAFDTSPRMSTYLLAFVTGDLQRKTTKTKDGVEVNVWATKAQPAESLNYALDEAVKVIEFYNEYFGTAYPLPKSDHVALPDFTSGAMENWGLITYREIALLVDPKIAGISSRQYVSLVIAHELAHQWFGNLVTMKWWNNLWLNESFATLMEYVATDAIHPDWNMWLEFSTSEPIMALRRDSIDGVQAVQVDVAHPDEITTLFDGAIVYAKGARLLHMLQHFVGNAAFQTGLKQYFQDFAYKNTEANDLWQAVATASGKDIVSIMNTWISQSGYPVVHVTRDGETVTLTQEQFFIGPHDPSDRLWPIPLSSNSPAVPELLTEKSASFTSSEPIRLNVDNSGHFLTHYDEASLKAVIDTLDELRPVDRLQILHEATLLARSGVMPSAQLIPLVKAFENETNEQVWGMIALALAELRKFIEDSPEAETKLRQLSGKIARKQYERLGWEAKPGESEDDTKLRATIVGLTMYGEDKDALATARDYYDTKKLDELDPELRPSILSSVARYGDSKVVDDLLKIYQSTSSSELKNDICLGLTSTRVPESIDKLLMSVMDPKIIRPQDAFRWFIYMIRTRDARNKAWQWARDNWDWIDKTFGGDKSYDDYPRYAASALVTRQHLEEYKDFFDPKKEIVALTRVITMGISELEGRVELIERDKPAVQKALLDL